jgi:stage II sporulation protein GA (sporulation sigma-E factor processing peptidase)
MYSLYIFFPEQNVFLSLVIKITMALTIVFVSFGISKAITFKAFLCFCIINFAFSGLNFAMWIIFRPYGMIVKNGVVYFNISPLVLILSTLVAYLIIEASNRILGKNVCREMFCKIKLSVSGDSAEFEAQLDTGNGLKEPFSNLPVILANKSCLGDILPKEMDFEKTEKFEDSFKNWGANLRLIPFGTISGKGILVAFKPDYLIIETEKGSVRREAYVAVCPALKGALVSSDMIN